MRTIESVCNNALDEIGYKRHIGSIWEGTLAARVALDIWGQTRDEMLHMLAPDWSRKDGALVLLSAAPADGYATTPWSSAFPPLPWKYQYAFLPDMVNPLQIKPRLIDLPDWRPRAQSWRLAQNPANSATTILTNVPDAVASYTAQVLDPEVWHDDFTMLLIQNLAKKFAAQFAARQQPQPQRESQNANSPG